MLPKKSIFEEKPFSKVPFFSFVKIILFSCRNNDFKKVAK